jgi:arylsulfatase A-like enzyme
MGWLERHLGLGSALGLVLGAGGEAWLRLNAPASGDAPNSVLVALSAASGFAATAMLLGGLGALAMGATPRPIVRSLARLGSAFGLALLATYHAAGLLLYQRAASYPGLSALRMLAASPRQLADQAVESYAPELIGLALLFSGLVAVGYGLLGAAPENTPGLRRRAWLVVGLPVALHCGCLALGLGVYGAVYLRATPEGALLASVADAEPAASATRSARPEDGPPRSAETAFWRSVAGHRGARPNVILLVLESVSAAHLGSGGYARPVSPRLDALAQQSLRATRAWSTSSQSNYAQMALLSSLHPRRGEHLDTYTELPYPRVLPHDVFARLGYATATVSSQNESWLGMRTFQTTATPNPILDAANHPGPHLGTGLEGKLPDHVSVDRALAWIDSVPREQPFQLYLNLQRTHFPYELPAGFPAPFQPADPDPARFGFLGYPASELDAARNRYDNALGYVDAQVGRLSDALAARDRLRDTLWVITADHGESFHDQGLVTHGNSLRESQTRVPLWIHWPGRVTPGEHTGPVSALDVMPSLLALLGLPAHPAYQGRASLGGIEPPGAPAAQYLTLQGLRYGDAIVCWPYKLIHDSNLARLSLYDLARDPAETADLMDPNQPRARALAEVLLTMVQNQRAYHGDPSRMARSFAPRLPACPKL